MEEFLYRIYEKLGAFFTGSQRRALFYRIIFIGLFFVLALEFFVKFTIGTDTLFWLFSSVVQSLFALVALVGVVVVFKYQSMATREDRLLEELNKGNSDLAILGGKLTATSSGELIDNIKLHVPEVLSDKDGHRVIKLRRVKVELEFHEFARGFLRDYMIKISIYIFVVVMLGFFALVITPFLASFPYLAIISIYAYLFFVADILRLVSRAIAETIS